MITAARSFYDAGCFSSLVSLHDSCTIRQDSKRTLVSWFVLQTVHHLSFDRSGFDEEDQFLFCVVESRSCNLQKKQQQSCIRGTSDFTAHFGRTQTVVNMLLASLLNKQPVRAQIYQELLLIFSATRLSTSL